MQEIDPNLQRELFAFAEKIALAELEVNKAQGRVKELEYQKARFCLDIFLRNMEEEGKRVKEQQSSVSQSDSKEHI